MIKRIIFAAMMLAALPALAGPFDPSAGDASMKILGEAFAGLLPGSSGAGPLSAIFKIFNTAILLVGAVIVAYTLIIGTLQTAHDGEMMGKRWSSIWVPLRTALGFALIFPVGGFCAAQMMVMWLAVQGIGVADRAWEAFASSSLARDDTVIQPHTPRVDAFASQALAALVCVEAINKVIAQTPGAAAMGATPAGISAAQDTTGSVFGIAGDKIVKREIMNFGGGAVAINACGQIAFENKTEGGTGIASGAGFMGLKWVGLQKQLVPPTATEAAHRQAVVSLVQGLQPLARAVVYAGDEGWAAAEGKKAALITATAAYKKAVVSAAMGEAKANGMDGMAEAMAEDGWLLAGSWFLRIVKSQNDINAAIESVPQIHASKPDVSMFSDELDRSQIRLDSLLKTTGAGKFAIQTFAQTKGSQAPTESTAATMNSIVKAVSDIDLSGLSSDPRNPLIIAKDIGDSLLGWAAAAFAALAAISIVVGAFSGLIGPFVGMILFSGTSAGVLLSLYTPFVPYVIWMGAVMGWLVLLVEAIAAAPLVALSKLDPNGDGMLGASKNGYILILSLVLRPVLMVIGMVCALTLLGPVGRFINATALDTLALTKGSGLAWVLATIGGVFIYAAVLLAVLHALFSLVHVVPDRIIRWIGGHDSHTGTHAADAEQRGKNIVGGVASSTQNTFNQSVSRSRSGKGGPTPAPGNQDKGNGAKPATENKASTTENKTTTPKGGKK